MSSNLSVISRYSNVTAISDGCPQVKEDEKLERGLGWDDGNGEDEQDDSDDEVALGWEQ